MPAAEFSAKSSPQHSAFPFSAASHSSTGASHSSTAALCRCSRSGQKSALHVCWLCSPWFSLNRLEVWPFLQRNPIPNYRIVERGGFFYLCLKAHSSETTPPSSALPDFSELPLNIDDDGSSTGTEPRQDCSNNSAKNIAKGRITESRPVPAKIEDDSSSCVILSSQEESGDDSSSVAPLDLSSVIELDHTPLDLSLDDSKLSTTAIFGDEEMDENFDQSNFDSDQSDCDVEVDSDDDDRSNFIKVPVRDDQSDFDTDKNFMEKSVECVTIDDDDSSSISTNLDVSSSISTNQNRVIDRSIKARNTSKKRKLDRVNNSKENFLSSSRNIDHKNPVSDNNVGEFAITCVSCKLDFPNVDKLFEHESASHDIPRYPCPSLALGYCAYGTDKSTNQRHFSSIEQLHDHVTKFHEVTPRLAPYIRWKCYFCNTVDCGLDEYKAHLSSDTVETRRCKEYFARQRRGCLV